MRDHLHWAGEPEVAQVDNLPADFLHRVRNAEYAQAGDFASDVVDRNAEDRLREFSFPTARRSVSGSPYPPVNRRLGLPKAPRTLSPRPRMWGHQSGRSSTGARSAVSKGTMMD
jgi:hypothetical protein